MQLIKHIEMMGVQGVLFLSIILTSFAAPSAQEREETDEQNSAIFRNVSKHGYANNDDEYNINMNEERRREPCNFTLPEFKLIMYRFHYDNSMQWYEDKIKLLITDTDSLMYLFQAEDIYTDIKECLHLFHTSDYPHEHPCYSEVNKKKLGTFKDEMKAKPISFVEQTLSFNLISNDIMPLPLDINKNNSIPPPDLEECKRINKLYDKNENFNYINSSLQHFRHFLEAKDQLGIPDQKKLKTIYFLGNKGAGKMALAQFLVSDSKIETITSKNLYPNLLLDKTSGYVLVDYPRIRDAISPLHEMTTTLSLRLIDKDTDTAKFVVALNHESLKIGANKKDFVTFLNWALFCVRDIEKYHKNIFLIATKVENSEILKDGEIIKGIADFLEDIANNLNKLFPDRPAFLKKVSKVIGCFLQKTNSSYTHINIFRTQMKEGPFSNITEIQRQRQSIRDMLLSDENNVKTSYKDYFYVMSTEAATLVHDINKNTNAYVTNLSAIIVRFVLHQLKSIVGSYTSMVDAENWLIWKKKELQTLTNEIGLCKYTHEYVRKVKKFSFDNEIKIDCLTSLENTITALKAYLLRFELVVKPKHTPLAWNLTFKHLSEFVDEKLEQYRFLRKAFEQLSSYKYQKKFRMSNWNLNDHGLDNINKEKFSEFLNTFSLTEFDHIETDDDFLINVNTVVNITLKQIIVSTCEEGTLVFTGYFVSLSELDNYFTKCDNNSKIVILALHTIFIDKDLTNIAGRELIIIAPIWEVVGSLRISVNGQNGGDPLPKAEFSQVGRDGENGEQGGHFAGIGMKFTNGNHLKISASGGKGQNGQEGGDGRNGVDGTHANGLIMNTKKCGQPQGNVYVVVNFIEEKCINRPAINYKNSPKNSGAGGLGGWGGQSGTVVIHNIGSEHHGVTIVSEDGESGAPGKTGTPGKGGRMGCDIEVTKIKAYIFFIPLPFANISRRPVNCDRKENDGSVIPNERSKVKPQPLQKNYTSLCVYIIKFQEYYVRNYISLLSDGVTKQFIHSKNHTEYY